MLATRAFRRKNVSNAHIAAGSSVAKANWAMVAMFKVTVPFRAKYNFVVLYYTDDCVETALHIEPLAFNEFGEQPPFFYELFIGAVFDDAAAFQVQDTVAVLDG